MRACPGCGLSLADNGVFCPSCGWQQAAATTRDASTGTPATTGAAPAGIRPTTPVESPGSETRDYVTTVRKALGYVLVPAGVVLSCVAWWYTASWLDGVIHGRLPLMMFLTCPVFFICLFVSATLLGSVYPPALDRYLALYDRVAFDRIDRIESGTGLDPGPYLIDGMITAILFVVFLVRVLKS
jgi:hypothetical protein